MKWGRALYAVLIGILYGVIGVAQLLGFIEFYLPWLAIPLSIGLSVLAAGAYWRTSGQFYSQVFPSEQSGPGRWLDRALYACGILMVVLLIVIPVAGWPYTSISETLNWDAGAYHLPKALELLKTGSSWDMTISYGEYPYGYESLFSLAGALTRDGSLFGAAHLLTCLYFLFTLWLLVLRYTGLPGGASFFLSAFITMSGVLAQIDSNLWWVYKHLAYTIGKNDLFLGASLLAVVLHAPVGPRDNWKTWHPLGYGLASMLALSIKPNSLLVVGAISLWTVFWAWRWSRRQQERRWSTEKVFLPVLLALPGLWWIVRNLLAQGQIFTGGAMELQEWSIAANLLKPGFYLNVPQDLERVCLIFALSVVLALILRHLGWAMVVTFAVLMAGFAFTPASAYFGSIGERPEIAWRFGVAALAFAFLLPLAWFAPWLRRVYAWASRRTILQAGITLIVVAFSGWFLWVGRTVISYRPANAIVLEDQFREPVGVNGYHSAYDYIHRNVRNSVVWVENGLPFYVYGPGFTNSTTRTRKSDYLVVFQTPWSGGIASYPDYLSDPGWQAGWRMVYEDSQGRVYHRLK